MFGIPLALRVDVSPVRAVVQGAGSALCTRPCRFAATLARSRSLQREIGRYAFVRASQLAQMAGCTRFHVIKRGWPDGVTQHRWTLSAARGTALEARLRRMAQRETTQGRISRVRENEAGAENYLRDRIWRSAKLTRVNPRRARSGRRCRNRAMPRTRGFARDAAMLPKDVPQLVHSRRQIVEYVDAGIDWERPRDARL
jgi:hypothetical protein